MKAAEEMDFLHFRSITAPIKILNERSIFENSITNDSGIFTVSKENQGYQIPKNYVLLVC